MPTLFFKSLNKEVYRRQTNITYRSNLQRLHIDAPLLCGLILLVGIGLTILYSAANQDVAVMTRQGIRLSIAFVAMLVLAQVPPHKYKSWTPWLYIAATALLVAVLIIGKVGKGAQRWLDLGVFRFQPSELMKLIVPMMAAWYLANKPLPPNSKHIAATMLLILIPAVLTAKQPDLGTALMIVIAGVCVLLFAGISWRLIASGVVLAAIGAPILWHYMHDYQRQRVLTFLNPERDPLGSGYHIIQSKIAIGSGGLFGKGWLNGTQSHLHFLPEHATDFIFAVCGEEFGIIGCTVLLLVILAIVGRSLYIALNAQDTFTRLLGASISLAFFLSAFVNIGMVMGILPVVGLPLPLISYGGTSMVIVLASFGVLMSIQTHRKLLSS